MPETKIYYIAGRKKKMTLADPDKHEVVNGVVQNCTAVVSSDPARDKFKKKFLSDENFRTRTLRWTKKEPEAYMKEYDARAKPGPKNNIKHDGQQMVSTIYEVGFNEGMDGETKVKVKTKSGKIQTFDIEQDTCPWDESHEADDLPEDVTEIKGFGVASLLLVMQRRFIENLQIYTYVGDVVLCLNPYMYLPAMVDISRDPVKQYRLGKEPHSYASAHFAYWGVVDPDNFGSSGSPRDQSCIVSGESGAGKTVACTFIMKYLAFLSSKSGGGGGGGGEAKTGDNIDIASKVGGVSPFLEAFGNAKTNMNDNSSRFGKFTMIKISNGKVVGAGMENYLLEKARLVDQGGGERNYHIFYFLIKGATKEEQALFHFKDMREYDMLYHGHTIIIDNETDKDTGVNTYDFDRMNNSLNPDDPDETGVRAALKMANVDESQQAGIWKVLVGLLQMGNLSFKSNGADKSEVKEKDEVAVIEKYLGIENLGANLCIFRRIIQKKALDSTVGPKDAMANRDALIKDIYGRIFDWLIHTVCNTVLKPPGDDDGFVGLLDIFGFEVFKRNSIEQLCINFANEKLQKLFNDHIFEEERKTYKKEGLPEDVIPPYKNNTPCCNLVEKGGKYMGILPHLDEYGKKDSDTDEKYCLNLIKKWGRDAGKKGPGCKSKAEIQSGMCFSAKKVSGAKWFEVKHFAGPVRYYVEGWIEKNKDQLPVQLSQIMAKSTFPLLNELYNMKVNSKLKTLASKFKHQLGSLAKTLNSTTPHYVRCVKPNDIHFRPVDGTASFDHWKTYRQLKFAGVMEVVRIKKEGYPFRETYEEFWNRCKRKGYAKAAPGVDESMDAKEGCRAIAESWLPGPSTDKEGNTRPFWTFGNTLFFGKDNTTEQLMQSHQRVVAALVIDWTRYHTYFAKYKDFIWAQRKLVSIWRRKLEMRRLAKIEAFIIEAQAQLRAVNALNELRKRRKIHVAAKMIQDAYRPYRVYTTWSNSIRALGRIEEVKMARLSIQHAWRNYSQYQTWAQVLLERIHVCATEKLDRVVTNIVDGVSTKLARHAMQTRIRRKLRDLRDRIRAQAHIRTSLARFKFRELQKRLEIVRQASYKAQAAYAMVPCRLVLRSVHIATCKIQKHVRRYFNQPSTVWWRWTTNTNSKQRRPQFKAHSGTDNNALEKAYKTLWSSSENKTIDVVIGSSKDKIAVRIERSRRFGPFVQLRQSEQQLCYRVKTRRNFRSIRACAVRIQSFIRGHIARVHRAKLVQQIRDVQKWYRDLKLESKYMRVKNAALTIENKLFYSYIMKKRLKRWIEEMCSAAMQGDVPQMRQLLFCDEPWERLSPLRSERIPEYGGGPYVDVNGLINLRHPFYFTSFLHMATKSGSYNAVKLLLAEGAEVESRSAILETPMHLSCGSGDALLRISKLLYECATLNSGSQRWVLSHHAMTESGDTVFDVAMACFAPKQRTLEWLRSLRADASMEPDEALRQEHMRQEYLEAQQRKMEAYEAEIEQKERDTDKMYQYLMLESSDIAKKVTESRQKRYNFYRSEEFQDELRAKIVLGHTDSTDEEVKEAAKTLLRSTRSVSPVRHGEGDVEKQDVKIQEETVQYPAALRTPRMHVSPVKSSSDVRAARGEEKRVHQTPEEEERSMKRLREMRARLQRRTAIRNARRKEYARRQRDLAYAASLKRKSNEDLLLNEEEEEEVKTSVPQGDSEWSSAIDPATGNVYYYNVTTRETSWIPPTTTNSSAKQQESPLERGAGIVTLDDLRRGENKNAEEKDEHPRSSEDLARELRKQRELQSKLDFLQNQFTRKRQGDVENAGTLKSGLFNAYVAICEMSPSPTGWYYYDQDGHLQGPYASTKMAKWHMEGYIPDDLVVRYGNKGPFRPLEELFRGCGATNPFLFRPRQDLDSAAEKLRDKMLEFRMRYRN